MQTIDHLVAARKVAVAEHARLTTVIASLDKMLGEPTEALPSAVPPVRKAASPRKGGATSPRKAASSSPQARTPRGSLLDNVIAILQEADSPLSTKDIAARLVANGQTNAKNPYSSVYSTLAKSGATVGIKNIGSGVWAYTPKGKPGPKKATAPATAKPVVQAPPPDLDAEADGEEETGASADVEEEAAAAVG